MCIGRYIERAMPLQQKQFRSIYWRSARIPTVRYLFSGARLDALWLIASPFTRADAENRSAAVEVVKCPFAAD